MSSPHSVGLGVLLILVALARSHPALAAGEAAKFPDVTTHGDALTSVSHAIPAGATMLKPLAPRPASPAATSPARIVKPRDFASSAPVDPAAVTAAQRAKAAALETGTHPSAPASPDAKLADIVTILPGDANARAAAAPQAKAGARPNEHLWSVSPALGTIPRAEWTGAVRTKPASFGTVGPSLTAPGAVGEPVTYPPVERMTREPIPPRPPEVGTTKPGDPAAASHRKEVRP